MVHKHSKKSAVRKQQKIQESKETEKRIQKVIAEKLDNTTTRAQLNTVLAYYLHSGFAWQTFWIQFGSYLYKEGKYDDKLKLQMDFFEKFFKQQDVLEYIEENSPTLMEIVEHLCKVIVLYQEGLVFNKETVDSCVRSAVDELVNWFPFYKQQFTTLEDNGLITVTGFQ